MDGVRFERWSGGAGLGFVVLFVAGTVVGFGALRTAMAAVGGAGSSSVAANAEQMVAVALEGRVGLGVSAYLLSLAAVLFVWFSSGLALALRRGQDREGGLWMLVFAGGWLYAAHLLGWISVLTQGVFMASYAAKPGTAILAAGTRTAVDVVMRLPYDKIVWAPDWMFPGILFLGATGLSARASSALPRWLGRLSLGLAAALIVLAGIGDITSDPIQPISWFGFPVFLLVWVPWTSIVLLRGAGRRADSTAGTGRTAPLPARSA